MTNLEKPIDKSDGSIVRLENIYEEIGETDKALIALQKGLEIRDNRMVWLKSSQHFDSIRNDSRFQEILRKMNLQ